MSIQHPNLQDHLNKMNPVAAAAKLGDMLNEMITKFNGAFNTAMLTKAGLAIKTASSPVVHAASPIAAVIDGVTVGTSVATDMPALVGTLAAANSALWAFYIDGNGALSVSAKTADSANHAAALALLPAVPDDVAMIGFIVVDNGTASPFVGGTTALDTASLTVTYYDTIGGNPLAPIVTPLIQR